MAVPFEIAAPSYDLILRKTGASRGLDRSVGARQRQGFDLRLKALKLPV
jgi:hypothetical protein